MKLFSLILLSLVILSLVVPAAFAAGNAEKGKAMFNDPKLGTNGKSCGSCHPNGKGLEKAGDMSKKEWKTPAGKEKSLEDAVNICITVALKGKALDKKSQQMHDMVAYIHSLGKAPMKHSSGY